MPFSSNSYFSSFNLIFTCIQRTAATAVFDFFLFFSNPLFSPGFPYFPLFLHYLSEILAPFSLFYPPQFLTFKNSGTKILNELAEIGVILDAKRFYAFFLSKLYR